MAKPLDYTDEIMKNTDILPNKEQKIEKCADNIQKNDENLDFSAGVAQMLFWDQIPRISNAYHTYCAYLSLMYSNSTVIIEVEENGKGKKKIGK